jgi:hypothetical protein
MIEFEEGSEPQDQGTPPAPDFGKMQAELDAAKADLAKVKPFADLLGDPETVQDIRRSLAASRVGFQQPQQTYQPSQADMSKIKDELKQRFFDDPVSFIADAVAQGSRGAVESGTGPMAEQMADLYVDNFKTRMAQEMGDDYKTVEPEFEKLRKEVVAPAILSRMNSAQREMTMRTLADAAYGKAALKAKQNATSRGLLGGNTISEAPPSYGGKASARVEPTKVKAFEDDEVAELKSLGFSDAQLAELAKVDD